MAGSRNPAGANGGASETCHVATDQSEDNQRANAAQPITVVIDGTAVAKGRPRITRRSFAYTPAKTRAYEAHGRLAAQLAMGARAPIAAPVRMVALVELPIPASWSGKRRTAAITGDIRPTSRPDIGP